MKNLLYVAAFAVMIMTFYGCPIGIDYPMSQQGSEKIEKDLLGTWIAKSEDPEVKRISFAKKDDFTYAITVLERGEMYSLETDNLTGWVTKLEGKTFLVVKPEGEEQYYHYQIPVLESKSITTCDVSLLDGGVDSVISTESFRAQVTLSMKRPEFCDETISWVKE